MDFAHTPRALELQERVRAFMQTHVFPAEHRFEEELAEQTTRGKRWSPLPVIEELKPKARAAGLWNLWLPATDPSGGQAGGAHSEFHAQFSAEHGAGLTNVEYAPLAEIMGQIPWAPEIFNCSAPDTGNMETLRRYAAPEHRERWLKPLLAGEIRSAFAMTEPAVASSDATNIETRIERDGDEYVVTGRKWWISGAGDPRCKIMIVMGKSDPNNPSRHAQQSMILVPVDTEGVKILRPLSVYGYDDAPHGHCEVVFDHARVPASNILLGEGRGFEIAQGRLGPGRIHHCMRLLGLAERALELMCKRLTSRVAFGKPVSTQSVWHERIADARCRIEMARLLTMKAAYIMDKAGNKSAQAEIAMIKVVAPNVACDIIDQAIQAHGGGGVSDDFPLAGMWAGARTLRFADGPDEVHRAALAKLELGKYAAQASTRAVQGG